MFVKPEVCAPRVSRRCFELLVSASMLLASNSAIAEESWYRGTGSHCSGNVSVSAALGALAPSTLKLEPTAPAGNYAIVLTPQELAEFKSQPVPRANVTLSAAQATDLRQALKSAADSKVPLFFKLGVSLLTSFTVTGPLSSFGVGWLFDQAYSNLEAPAVSLSETAHFIAEGGNVSQAVNVASRNEERFGVVSQAYSVSVGKEFRSFNLYTCLYPININVTKFTTASGMNDKKLVKVSGDTWKQWDVTDGKWDATEPYTYLYQSEAFYYFSKPAIENNAVVGQNIYRLSTRGGAWERKRFDAQKFQSMYASLTME